MKRRSKVAPSRAPKAKAARPIYIETAITNPPGKTSQTTVDTIWSRTQEPHDHQRWDLRFTDITYLPPVEGEPQRFFYATTVAPGLTVNGRGETLGERHRADGTAYSGLKFWSDHPLSLIAEGSGYWRYITTTTGVRFLTKYDYRVRWGAPGRLIDRMLFRPVFGWETAWSFDRLRLWIEHGVPPEHSRNRAIVHALAILAVIATVTHRAFATTDPFGSAATNLALALFTAIAAGTWTGRPSGRRPLRQPPPLHLPDRPKSPCAVHNPDDNQAFEEARR